MTGLLLALLAGTQGAASYAAVDPRILTLPYSETAVVPLAVASGYAVVVEIGEDERIENVVVGASAGWQVTANRRGDHLIVKPLDGAAATNLVMTTDVRRYVFTLRPGALTPDTPFVVHFTYPEPAPATGGVAALYRLRGAKELFPTALSDDGLRTTVRWSPATPLPAVYAVDRDGREALVNGRMSGGAFVIEGVADGLAFRRGKLRATARRLPAGTTR